MGRISKIQRSNKNKKIKAVDPFYHGDRKGVRSAGHNQAPKNLEQHIPKKLKMIHFFNDKSQIPSNGIKKSVHNESKPSSTLCESDAHSGKSNFKRKLDRKIKRNFKESRGKIKIEERAKPKSKQKKYKPEEFDEYVDTLKPETSYLEPFKFERRQNETKKQFKTRVEIEAHKAIKISKFHQQNEVSEDRKITIMLEQKKKGNDNKKKRHAEKKKKKIEALKEKKKERSTGFAALRDKVEFGDVVHAPPVLTTLPKRAQASHDKPGLRMPELHEAIRKNMAESQQNSTPKNRKLGETLKRKSMSSGMQLITDARRDDFINTYRNIKKQKLK